MEDHRRKWDHDEYERQALERMVKDELGSLESGKKEAPVKRDLLRPRDYRVSIIVEVLLSSWAKGVACGGNDRMPPSSVLDCSSNFACRFGITKFPSLKKILIKVSLGLLVMLYTVA